VCFHQLTVLMRHMHAQEEHAASLAGQLASAQSDVEVSRAASKALAVQLEKEQAETLSLRATILRFQRCLQTLRARARSEGLPQHGACPDTGYPPRKPSEPAGEFEPAASCPRAPKRRPGKVGGAGQPIKAGKGLYPNGDLIPDGCVCCGNPTADGCTKCARDHVAGHTLRLKAHCGGLFGVGVEGDENRGQAAIGGALGRGMKREAGMNQEVSVVAHVDRDSSWSMYTGAGNNNVWQYLGRATKRPQKKVPKGTVMSDCPDAC
jgi:hypothetical protein